MTLGWQLQPRFAIVQGAKSVHVLELIRSFFGCGGLYRNRRHDNHKEDLFVYNVHRRSDLVRRIVPFFEANPLLTAKWEEFLKFREILRLMESGVHLTVDGLRRIAQIQQTMNHRKPSRFLESSEAIRQPTLLDGGVEDMVLAPWRHGDAKSEIPCRVSSDLHEWRNDLGTVSTRDSAKLQYE